MFGCEALEHNFMLIFLEFFQVFFAPICPEISENLAKTFIFNMLTEDQKFIIEELFENGVFKFGDFTLKAGNRSPVYVDLRIIVSFPKLLQKISDEINRKIHAEKIQADCVCGVPYAALPIASCLSVDYDLPMLIFRKEVKKHGTAKRVEGRLVKDSACLIIEDTVSTGSSIIETVKILRDHELSINDVIVVMDRDQGANDIIKAHNLNLHSLFTLPDVLQYLYDNHKISQEIFDSSLQFIRSSSTSVNNGSLKILQKISLDQRLNLLTHPRSKQLWEIIKEKRTNLCIALDLIDAQEILDLIPKIGSEICLLKLHADIIINFSTHFVNELKKYAENYKFLLIEDRKFADIGNTVALQLEQGFAQISTWAHFVTVHAVGGPGTLIGLKEACIEKNIGCLLVAELSSNDALCNNEAYKSRSYEMAKQFSDIVAGFICQKRSPIDDDTFIYMTPGVNCSATDDGKQQQWRSPDTAVKRDGNDVVIVGRGIYQSVDPVSAARKYKTESWESLTSQDQ